MALRAAGIYSATFGSPNTGSDFDGTRAGLPAPPERAAFISPPLLLTDLYLVMEKALAGWDRSPDWTPGASDAAV
jgi:hypothetical protein